MQCAMASVAVSDATVELLRSPDAIILRRVFAGFRGCQGRHCDPRDLSWGTARGSRKSPSPAHAIVNCHWLASIEFANGRLEAVSRFQESAISTLPFRDSVVEIDSSCGCLALILMI
jgi:hypothetical protein